MGGVFVGFYFFSILFGLLFRVPAWVPTWNEHGVIECDEVCGMVEINSLEREEGGKYEEKNKCFLVCHCV